MASLTKLSLPPLETPLNYPECLERITQAAINRANYEILNTRLYNMLYEDIQNQTLDIVSAGFYKE